MPTQNELFSELVIVVLQYVAELKGQLANAMAQNAADREVIAQKEGEAAEARQLYEGYVANDSMEDGALIEMIEKFRSDLETIKAA